MSAALLRRSSWKALVLLDFAMSGMNGAEVARELKAKAPGLPIIFASGYSDTAALVSVLGEGTRVLRKPFSTQDLKQEMNQALS